MPKVTLNLFHGNYKIVEFKTLVQQLLGRYSIIKTNI